MEDTVIIGGRKYKLVPEEDEEKVVDDYVASPKESPKNVGKSGYPEAVPRLSGYKERYKKRQLLASDITAQRPVLTRIDRQDKLLDSYTHKGEKLFFGEGLTQEI